MSATIVMITDQVIGIATITMANLATGIIAATMTAAMGGIINQALTTMAMTRNIPTAVTNTDATGN